MTAQESKRNVGISIGWWCLCDCDHYWEPEGFVSFAYHAPPMVGNTVRLGDGKDWTIVSVNEEECEFRVSRK